MSLGLLRDKIDAIDRQLVDLINQRLACAAEIGRIKRSQGGEIYVPEREEAVLRQVAAQNGGPLKPAALRAIYREIMSAAIALEKPLAVAYLGPEASDTHAAAVKKFGASIDYQAMTAIADIFTAVEKGEADLAVVPIEKSTDGSGDETLDSFIESDLKVVAQIRLEITYVLISRSPAEKIERILAQDQVLARCRQWLGRHVPHAKFADALSASRAVQIAKEDPTVGAVANELAADRYGVPVVARNLQDRGDYTTRFFVLGRKPAGPVGGGKDTSSFLIALGKQAAAHSGALLKLLRPLGERGINLSKIESRPSKRRPWDHYFLIDVTGHHDDPAMKEAIADLRKFCPLVKWLGSYPAAG